MDTPTFYLVKYEAPDDWVHPGPFGFRNDRTYRWCSIDAVVRRNIQAPGDTASKVFHNVASAKGSATKARALGLKAEVVELNTYPGKVL